MTNRSFNQDHIRFYLIKRKLMFLNKLVNNQNSIINHCTCTKNALYESNTLRGCKMSFADQSMATIYLTLIAHCLLCAQSVHLTNDQQTQVNWLNTLYV